MGLWSIYGPRISFSGKLAQTTAASPLGVIVVGLRYCRRASIHRCMWPHLIDEDIKATNIVVFHRGQARKWILMVEAAEGLECTSIGFSIAVVLLEDLTCEGEGLDRLIRLTKT